MEARSVGYSSCSIVGSALTVEESFVESLE